MRKAGALVVSLVVGLAVAGGVFAVGRTGAIRADQQAATDKQVALRTAQLNRYEASLKSALAGKPPRLPKLPAPSKLTPLSKLAPPAASVPPASANSPGPAPTVVAAPVARASVAAPVVYTRAPALTRTVTRAAPPAAYRESDDRYGGEMSDD